MEKLVVLGGGESGVGAAILGKVKGFDVWLSDSGALKDKYRNELEDAGIAYEEGGHTEDKVMAADLVVKSPGIPETAPMVVKLKEKGTPIISEIEFAGRYSKAKFIGITGANGKTTTTLLIHHLLRTAGMNAQLAGNVGFSMARQVAQGNEPEWYVIELSSFQLDNMYDFRCDIAVLCNITPDHMDRYNHDFGLYAAAKYRITQNMGPEQHFIYNADDKGTLAYFNSPKATCYAVSTIGRSDCVNAYGDTIQIAVGTRPFYFAIADLPIKGLHNIYNSMQAMTAALLAGAKPEAVTEGMKSFRNAAHRLEVIRTLDGVEYINDSKATNVDAAWYALDAQTRPVVWIAGGKDKGNDYSVLNDLCRNKVKALVCMGKDNKKLIESFTGIVPIIEDTHSLEDCVAACRRLATAGDVVLLSPCCASFDLFTSYENRGDLFREAVNALK
ncbi:MAG: UDP-N-acetylmuramoyl-L-alanine--D-glutamate ligase [Bacteroidales bacterium]|nr:UDP-N-acetylmuramoyl-L-alanine--D-glutamate ligase [Bacteroidales bacterium]